MSTKAPSILIVDDSPEIVEGIGTLLVAHGYRVNTALSASEALRKLHKSIYEIVVCDIEMPGMSGLEFLEKIRHDGPNQEVILMTGHLEQEYFIRAIRLGAADFISKPIETQHLLKSIEAIISRANARRRKDKLLGSFERAEFSCVIDPHLFSGTGVTKILNPILFDNLELPHDTISDLLTCADEMLQNAYIHGVLELTDAERLCERDQLKEIIAEKLHQPQICSRRVRFSLALDKDNEAIIISVEDDGQGFDHEAWLKLLREDDKLSLRAHGRGLAMLYFLSDKLEFANGGRSVRVLRSLRNHRNSKA